MHLSRHMTAFILLIALAFLALPAQASAKGVQVLTGLSPIVGAEAASPTDITLMNDKLAVSFAIASDAPWGVPRGGILDVAPVIKGKVGKDRMTLVDFIPNNWSDWPPTEVNVSTAGSSPDKAVLTVLRKWGDVDLQCVYTLAAGSDALLMKATMTNHGSVPLEKLLSGFVMWPEGGALFPPAKSGVVSHPGSGALEMAPATHKYTVAYDEDWAITMLSPYADTINYEGKDLYRRHSLAPGASESFEARLQLIPAGDSTAALLAWDPKAPGKVSGTVKAAGKALKEPVVVVEQNGEMLAWAQGKNGKFAFTLPAGDYDLYATGKGYLPGKKSHVSVSPQKAVAVNFTDLKAPGAVKFKIVDEQGKPLPARVTIEKGSQPPVRFLGARTFFTELDRPGELEVQMAPGDYTFKVNSGWPFLAKAPDVSVNVPGGETVSVPVTIATMFEPAAKGWVSLDMHHHSDLLDGVTPPEYLVRSQAAGRLDYLFLSDHDTMDNLKKVDAIAKKYGFRFVPALEISPSWAHFNAMPMPLDKPFPINPATATATEIFKAARDLGAQIIVANHPMIVYGYLASLDTGKIPGGFDPGFDNFEINSDGKFMQAIPRVWDYWNKGQFYPYTAGTDIHDVWNYISGRNRLFVFMDKNDLNDQATLFKQIKAGRAYASMGPLVFPEIMFGSTLKHKTGEELSLKYDVAAVDGLKEVLLISEGKTLESKPLNNETEASVTFSVKPEKNTWYAITVKDAADRHAWTNPVFVEVQ